LSLTISAKPYWERWVPTEPAQQTSGMWSVTKQNLV